MRALGQRVTSLRSPSPLSRSVRAHWCIWVSDSQDVPLATASDFPRRPGDTRRQSQVSYGDNRCGADVGTSADCTRFVEDDKRRAETNYDSKDNGGAGSSPPPQRVMG